VDISASVLMRAARRPVDSQGSVTVRGLSVMHGESFSITRHRSITTTTSASTASTAASAAAAAGADGDWFPRPLYHWKTGRMHDKQPADYALSQRVQLDSSTGIYLYTLLLASIEGGGSSIAERRVPELIPVPGSQPAGDVSHKPGGRLPLLSTRPAVTPSTLKRAATNFAAW